MKTNRFKINRNKFKIFILFLFITIIFSITAVLIFYQKRREEIKLENNFPVFTVELVGGNNQSKYLLPIAIPNLNKDKYVHLINLEHKAIFESRNIEVKEPLFLKITISFDTQNTFNSPDKYFDFQVITTTPNKEIQIYSDDKKPCYSNMKPNETQTIEINTKLQQKEIILSNNPKLYLVYDYELVDKQGKSISGGSNIVSNQVTNVVNR